MTQKGKGAVLVLIILMLVSLSLSVSLFYFLNKERTKNIALQEDLEDLNMKQKITETKLTESQEKVTELEMKLQDSDNKLQESQGQIDTLSKNLEQEKSGKENLLAQVDLLKKDLEEQKKSKADLETNLTQAENDLKKMQAQLEELGAKKSELEQRLKDIEAKSEQTQGDKGVELGKIVVNPESQAGAGAQTLKGAETPSSGLEGKVLVINKDYNFVVINLGIADGVKIGDIFAVYNNNKQIGDVRVEKIHDTMSAAGFISTETKAKVREGDKVVQKIQ